MKRPLRGAAALALAFLLAAAARADDAPAREEIPLTLEQCVQDALERATEVLKARHLTEASGVALLQGYAEFLPTVRTDDQFSRQWGTDYLTVAQPELESTDNHGGTLSLSASLNVFNGFADVGAFRVASRRDKAARLSLERARQDVALDVAQSYLQVLLDQQLVDIDESFLRVSRERQAMLAEQSRVGSRTYVDLYQQQAQTSASESALIAAKDAARDDLLLLLQKIRADLRKDYRLVPIALDTGPVAGLTGEQSLLDQALDRRPDLAAAREAWLAAQAGKTVARQGYFPVVNLGFGAASAAAIYNREVVNGVNEVPPSQPPLGAQFGDHVNYTVSASLSWLLFDRLATRLGVARAEQLERDARVDYEDSRLQVERDVRRAYGDYSAAAEQLRATGEGLRAAALAYEAMRARYDVGAANFLDLITAQNVSVQAQAAAAQAAIGMRLQRLVVGYALGDPPAGGS